MMVHFYAMNKNLIRVHSGKQLHSRSSGGKQTQRQITQFKDSKVSSIFRTTKDSGSQI